ncbi:MAG: hypothetical protein V4447_17510, partial [Pseudomonadota bacterium]
KPQEDVDTSLLTIGKCFVQSYADDVVTYTETVSIEKFDVPMYLDLQDKVWPKEWNDLKSVSVIVDECNIFGLTVAKSGVERPGFSLTTFQQVYGIQTRVFCQCSFVGSLISR